MILIIAEILIIMADLVVMILIWSINQSKHK
jgi:hypothetical protein